MMSWYQPKELLRNMRRGKCRGKYIGLGVKLQIESY